MVAVVIIVLCILGFAFSQHLIRNNRSVLKGIIFVIINFIVINGDLLP